MGGNGRSPATWTVVAVALLFAASAVAAGVLEITELGHSRSTASSPGGERIPGIRGPPPGGAGYSAGSEVAVGGYPANALFDPQNGRVFVANEASDNISVVGTSPLSVVSTVFTGLEARGMALDPTNGRLFVTNDYSSSISVVDAMDPSNFTTLTVPGYTNTLEDVFDAATGQLYVLANNNDDLLVFNGSSLAMTQVIPILANPGGAQYAIDNADQTIYFPARGYDEVELIGQQNGSSYATFPTPSPYGPTTTFLDPVNGLLYVMLGGLLDDPGNQIVVMNPATGQVVSTLTVGAWPNSYAYDPARELLYVTCQASDEVVALDLRTSTIYATIQFPVGSDPQGITVDPASGHLFVGELGTGTLVELGPSLPSPGKTPGPGGSAATSASLPPGILALPMLRAGEFPVA